MCNSTFPTFFKRLQHRQRFLFSERPRSAVPVTLVCEENVEILGAEHHPSAPKKKCPKKTSRQRNSFYQYSEALCTKVSKSHFQQVPLKFFSNFVTLFVTIPCNMGDMNNYMIFKKIKDLKKNFRKKPPTKF